MPEITQNNRIEKKLLSDPEVEVRRISSSPAIQKQGISDIETGVGGMNLSRLQETRTRNQTRGKSVLLTLANGPRSPPGHSHFLRSHGNREAPCELRVNIENIPQNEVVINFYKLINFNSLVLMVTCYDV